MTKEQLADLAAGPPTPMGLERLLEERQRLLGGMKALLAVASLPGDISGRNMVDTALAAIAFAEEEAP